MIKHIMRCQIFQRKACSHHCRAKEIREDIIGEVGKEMYEIFDNNPNINPLLAFLTAYCAVLNRANKICDENTEVLNRRTVN